ncbi:MAG: M23 family peptidase, partial [Actinomycetota bacterium]|nr:M23 family peptidase [Actinomycetota bacterium]
MTRLTGPALLERPRTDPEPAADAVLPAVPVATEEVPRADRVGTPEADAVEEPPADPRRRLPRP